VHTSGNNFRVDTHNHTYFEEGTYDVYVTLTHDALTPVNTPVSSIVIADQQLTHLATADMPSGNLESIGIGAITGIATFTDPAGESVETIADFTATIHWGDGQTSAGTIVSLSGGNYSVDAPDHTYSEEGNFGVYVTIKHEALPALDTDESSIEI